MTDATPEATETPEMDDDPGAFRVALGFFILPLFLVIVGVGVFLLFGVLAHEGTHPADYLQELNGRGINEPWQAAFHLSQQLQYDESLHGDEDFARQVMTALERADDQDPRVRRFLAVALGRVGHPVATPALAGLLADEDVETRVNAMWALGSVGADSAAEEIAGQLRHDDSAVRTMAGYVLGVLAEPSTSGPLEIALNDPVPSVRWNAAVALGMMGDPAGYEVLGRMIDREHLATVAGVDPTQHADTMLAALRALEELGAGGLESRLIRLRDDDPDLRVREAARTVLASDHGAAAMEASTRSAGAR